MEREELAEFLAKVDEIGALVSDLKTSDGTLHSQQALKKADEYLGRETEGKVVHNRTVINTRTTINNKSEKQTDEYFKTLEEDARQRGERRKEREFKGCEHKKKGNESFRAGQYDNAIQEFTLGLKHMPWDISLYTNRALAYNRLGHYTDAIVDCDAAIKLEAKTLKGYLQKAKALNQLKRYDEAEECYEEAKKQFPEKIELICSEQSKVQGYV